MVDRSVTVKLVAANGQFDDAMARSAKQVKTLGNQAKLSGSITTLALYRMRMAAIGFVGTMFLGAGQNLINLKQQAQTAFEAMTGDAQKASAMIQKIYEWDQKVPIPFQNALQSGQKLAAFGVDLKDIVPTLNAIADATGAVGGSMDIFDRIALALGQIQTKGKLSAEEMRQLAEAGLPAWQLLAEQMGVTTAQLQKMVTDRAVDADTALEGLRKGIEEKFPGAAQKMKDTTLGAFQSFSAGARNAAESILEPLQQTEKQGLLTGKAILEAAGAGIGSTLQGTMSAFDGLNHVLGITENTGRAISPVMSAVGLAMLGTHLGANKLNAAGTSLSNTFSRMGERMAVQTALARASGVELTKWGAFASRASIRAQGLAAGVRSAGAGMLSAFGGPLGVTIIGVTAALSAWGNAQQTAQKKEAEHEAQLAALKDTLDKVTGSLTAASTAKISKDWVDSGTIDKMKQLGVNTELAVQAVTKGGPAAAAFHTQLVQTITDAITSSDDFGSKITRNLEATGRTAVDIAEQTANGMMVLSTGSAAVDDELARYVDIAQSVNRVQGDLTQGSKERREAFELVAAAAANAAGVSTDKLLPALDAAKKSGGSVEEALKAVGIEGNQASQVITALSDYVALGSGNFHVMAGTIDDTGRAMAGASADADKLSDAMKRQVSQMEDALKAAQQLRDSVSQALTGFVNPVDAWQNAVDAVNQHTTGSSTPRTRAGTDPTVVAANNAVKAGRKRADSTKKSAKAERDAAVKAATAIRDALKDRAKADLDSAKTAEKAAKDRVSAAKKEADELSRLSDDQRRKADDAEQALRDAEFRKRAADAAVAAAREGLAGANGPLQQASWERALAQALRDQSDALVDLKNKTSQAADASAAATQASKDSKTAAKDQSDAEKKLASAQSNTAKATESSKTRQKQAENDYAVAKEQADTRYQKSVDAVQATLQALIDRQDAAKQSAQTMADQSSSAVGGMAKEIQPSLDQYLKQLEKQVKAQTQWKDNIIKLAGELPPGVALQLAQLGPSAAPLVQKLVDGTDKQLSKFAELFPQSTQQGTNGMLQEILTAVLPASQNAALLGDTVIQGYLDKLKNAKNDQDAQDALAGIINTMQQYAGNNPITIGMSLDLQQAQNDLLQFTGDKWVGVPGHAAGGSVADGWFVAGENGPELGYKQGSNTRLFSNPDSQDMLKPVTQSSTNITIIDNSTTYYPQTQPDSIRKNQQLQTMAAMI